MTDAPQDVLVHAKPVKLGHKRPWNLQDGEVAFWSVNGTPRQTEPGATIWFEHGGTIHAYGEIVELADGAIYFDAAHDVLVECPDDVPTRGFTYVEPVRPRIEEAIQ